MSLNMRGHVDSVFESARVTRIYRGNGYYDEGVWVGADEKRATYRANVQPLSDKEVYFLNIGGERISSILKLYINTGVGDFTMQDDWIIDGKKYKTIRCDTRKRRSYSKIIVELYDEQ